MKAIIENIVYELNSLHTSDEVLVGMIGGVVVCAFIYLYHYGFKIKGHE